MSGLTLAAVVRALGGDLYAGGQRANVPGPGHGPADRSVSLLLSAGRVVAHSFAGDDWRQVLDDLRRRGFVDCDGRMVGYAGGGAEAPPAHPSRLDRQARAQRLWAEGRALSGSAAALHLRLRGLDASGASDLRAHAGVAAAVYADRGPRRPALLAAIRDAGGALVGVEVTYLTADGVRARAPTPRKTIGLRPPGSAVRLMKVAPRMLVGEGVATSLSAARWFGLPCWALLSSGNLARWRPPAGVCWVLVAADRGRAGEAAARELARGLSAAGLHGVVRWPPRPHADWNDALRAEEGEEGRSGAGAADGRSGPPARRPPKCPSP